MKPFSLHFNRKLMQMAVDKQIIMYFDEEVASWSDKSDCLDRKLMMQL